MEKKLYDLVVNEKFERLCPQLREEERELLEESIIANGCEMPLIVWGETATIVDGHNRYRICMEHNIPFAVEERDFEDEDAVIYWIVTNQLGRRNLTNYAKCELVIPFEDLLKRMINARRRESVAETWRAKADGEGGSGPKLAQNPRTRDILASMAGVSHGVFDQVKKIMQCADEADKEKLRAGDVRINTVYTAIVREERKEAGQDSKEGLVTDTDEAQENAATDAQPWAPVKGSKLSPLLDKPIITDPLQTEHIDGRIIFNPIVPDDTENADESEEEPWEEDGGAEEQVREMADEFLGELNEVLETVDHAEAERILELIREMSANAETAIREKMKEVEE